MLDLTIVGEGKVSATDEKSALLAGLEHEAPCPPLPCADHSATASLMHLYHYRCWTKPTRSVHTETGKSPLQTHYITSDQNGAFQDH